MANQIFDTTSANAVLKELYDGQLPENMVYLDHPFLAMVQKKTDFGGRNYPIPVQYGVSQGRSSQFVTAQANQSANQYVEFLLTRAQDYSLATISNELLLAATTDRESFIRSATALVDGAITSCVSSLSSAMFRDGTGTIGAIGTISTGVITLANADQVTQFEVNMVLQANSTSGGTPRAALGYVIRRNAKSSTITVSTTFGGSAATPTGWTTGDSLLVQGDNNAKISGVAAWVPSSTPGGGDSFFGVNRSPDSRLYGLYEDYSDRSIEEAAIDGSTLLSREGGRPDVGIVQFSEYASLEKSLGSKVQYVDMKGPAEIAFRGIMVNGAKKQIKVFPDKDALPGEMLLLTMSTWTLASLLEAPMILKYGSNDEMLRVYNADQAELRVGYYANLGCAAPGWNARIAISS